MTFRFSTLFLCAAALAAAPARAQTFTPFDNANLDQVGTSRLAWGNYYNNGIGDLDLAQQGYGDGGFRASQYYTYGGNGGITNIGALQPVDGGGLSWGDFDLDGDLDLLQTGWNGSDGETWLYTNVNTQLSQMRMFTGVADKNAWVDYDNNGLLDAFVAGWTQSGIVAKLYHNDGGVFYEETGFSIPGLTAGDLAWGDFDNDGDPDLLITGHDGSFNKFTRLYENKGGRSGFSLLRTFDAVDFSSVAFIDYDADGFLDILVLGASDAGSVSSLYHNNGNRTFSLTTGTNIAPMGHSSIAVADYDNDGRQDVAVCGWNGAAVTRVYRNTSNGVFTQTADLPGVSDGQVAWGDFNNDSRPDLAVTGQDDNASGFAKVYLNNTPNANALPSAPGNLQALAMGNGSILFRWNRSTDAQLSGNQNRSLGYNIRLAGASNGQLWMSPMADSSGVRLLPQAGTERGDVLNRPQMAQWKILNRLSNVSYNWQVQAIDNNLQGGPFAGQASFTVTGGACYGDYLGNTASPVNLSSGTLDWAQWGYSSNTSFNHKGDPVAGLINTFTVYNGSSADTYQQTGTPPSFSWTGGTPISAPAPSPIIRGVKVNAVNKGFELKVLASTTERTLKVYVGVNKATARFEARMDDGPTGGAYNGSNTYSDVFENRTGLTNGTYQVKFRAAPGQTGRYLRVRLIQTGEYSTDNSDFSSLQAATLK